MSLKAELETWANALKAYDEEDFEQALSLFSTIADASKIRTNMGLIYATIGEHEAAVEQFIEATSMDQYLAVAYFQCGVSNFLLGRYELSLKDFEEALLYLRGNQTINYEQLGLKFKLYSAEVFFNKGLSQIYMGKTQDGMLDMEQARREKITEEHNVIDDAIRDQGEGYTVFSIPVGVLYRPSESKLKNAKQKNYMGTAKLVAASDGFDTYTTFTGAARLKEGITPSGVFVEPQPGGARSNPNLIRSATVPPATLKSKAAIDDIGMAPSKDALVRSNTLLNSVTKPPPQQPPVQQQQQSYSSPIEPNGPSFNRPRPNERPPPPPKSEEPSRLTEIYDDYLDAYGGGDSAPPPPVPPLPADAAGGGGRDIAAWARKNANPAYAAPSRSLSRSGAPSSYAPSSSGASSVRRRLTRRTTQRMNRYEEEEEGYASGDYDDAGFELVKIRVKLHYGGDVRGMAVTPEMPFEEFLDRITSKFGKGINGLDIKFKDEDGGKVSLRDDSDYELAIETARESAKGKPEGKLEIWCQDI